MRHGRRLLAGGLAAGLAAGLSSSSTRAHVNSARVNKVPVRLLEAAYRLDPGTMAVRVTLVTGEALGMELKDAGAIANVLRMAEILGSQRGRLFAEVEETNVVALDIAVP